MTIENCDKNIVCRKESLDSVQSDLRMRFDSESSSEDHEFDHLEPLEFDDLRRYSEMNESLDSLDSIDENGDTKITIFSVAMALKRKERTGKPLPLSLRPQNRATQNWLKALHLTRERIDPWQKFGLDVLPTEKAIRHRYNALNGTWNTEEVVVKMEKDSFAAGAMRECYRMKKLSNFSHNQDWARDSNNYVAKRYMDEEIPRKTYFEDVKLQMDAKLWGEEFNRHNPPKKVDIFMMAVLEFVERAGSPLFHVEHYIDGEYVKYNSNSGYVDNRLARQTPHAFSHFTFERSGHELIVVDIQGVGDLYTDPQIHTAEGKEYGDGNLGVKGMALFFHSHSCNAICKSLGLQPFDLAPKEKDEIQSNSGSVTSTSQTVVNRGDVVMCGSGSPSCSDRPFFSRSMSARSTSRNSVGSCSDQLMEDEEVFDEVEECSTDNLPRRRRYMTELSSESYETDLKTFQEKVQQNARPSNLQAEIERQNNHDDSILGEVHLALTAYHEICRFTDDGTYDKQAALFHLNAAADCGIIAAIVSLARMYFGLPHDILSDIDISDNDSISETRKQELGLSYMEKAGEAMDRSAMVFLAQSYDLGANGAIKDFDKALCWYENIIEYDEEIGGGNSEEWGLDDQPYLIMARVAELWLSGELNQGRDPQRAGDLYTQAADIAMSSMKGKLANKYFMLAEEAWGEVED